MNHQGGTSHSRFAINIDIIFPTAVTIRFLGYHIDSKTDFFKYARHLVWS